MHRSEWLRAEPGSGAGTRPPAGSRRQNREGASDVGRADTAATILGRFGALCREHPDRVAISDGTISLSFDTLDRASSRLAHYLAACGVRRGDAVALCDQPGVAPVTAFLAILKMGGVYLPLEYGEPAARLERMVGEAGARFILSSGDLPFVPAAATPVSLAGESAAIRACSDRPPPHLPRSGDIAYTIFTSGSSGLPKGVEIEHRNLAALADVLRSAFPLSESDRVLHIASLAYDASIWEIVLGLLCGGSLVCMPRKDKTPGEIAAAMAAQGITVATFTPSYLELLPPERLSGVHTLISAGEACSLATLRRWTGGRRFINAYGPTEATICAAMEACDPDADSAPPIGTAIPGARLHLLDAALQPAGIGIEGDIYVGGSGVGRCYRSNPALTAASFLPDPFGPPGSRLYRTGDRGRFLPDGRLFFTGRLDRTVKLRGIRTGLPEIEHALSDHPYVAQCLVLQAEPEGREATLHAMVRVSDAARADIPDGGDPGPVADLLRDHLAARLPDHMRPARYHILPSFPLLASGKVDVEALRRMAAGAFGASDEGLLQGPTETMVAEIWRRHLQLHAVCRTDHFLEIGGHSLVAVRVIADLRDTLDANVPVRLLFMNPHLSDFAKAIDVLMSEDDRSARQAAG